MKKPIVFISYAHSDAEFARKLSDDLVKINIDVRIDEKALTVGESISEFVETSIDQCDFFCLILSQKSIARPWVQREYRAALTLQLESDGRSPRILPILKESCSIPSLLKDVLYADFTTGYPNGLEALMKSVSVQKLDVEEAEKLYGPAPFANLATIVSDEILGLILSNDPAARILPENVCHGIYSEVLRSTSLLLKELCDVNKENVLINKYSEDYSTTLGKINALQFPSIYVKKSVDYLSHMDDVHITHSFDLSIGYLIDRSKKHNELVRSRALYLLPEEVEWSADGGYPDGMGEGGQTLQIIRDNELFPNKESWKKNPPEFGENTFN